MVPFVMDIALDRSAANARYSARDLERIACELKKQGNPQLASNAQYIADQLTDMSRMIEKLRAAIDAANAQGKAGKE